MEGGGDADPTDTIMEYQRREYMLLTKMAQREREMRKLRQQANEAVNSFEDTQKESLRGAFVDSTVNIEIAMLRQKLQEKDAEASRLKEETHNAAFHPNSIQGKQLVTKCSHLLEENSELGRQLGEEWMQTLRVQLAIEGSKRVQLKQRVAEFDRHAEQIDNENEQMQQRIADLGRQFQEAKAETERLKKEAEDARAGKKLKRAAKPLGEVEGPITVDVDAAPAVSHGVVAAHAGAPPAKKSKKDKDRDREKTPR